MMNQMVRHNTSSDDQPPAIEALLERLRTSHPDMSGWTVVSMTGRSRDFLHHQIHTRVGGLLPAVLSFDDYRTSRIAEATGGRAALPVEDALLRLHGLRCREEGRSLPPANTERLLSFLSTIAEFSVTREELRSLDRIGLEQIERIDGFFSLLDSFRSSLAGEGLFYPPFEAGRFAGLKPAANDLFFGLPLMTPASQSFFRRIPRERLYVDAPFFGSAMPGEPPGYESALSLMRRLGLPERRVAGQGLAFSELSERAGLPALLAQEIDAFLRAPRSDGEQLFIVPLDERLSFYLWQLLFRPLGNRINFAPWLPFTHFAPAQRLAQAVRGKTGLMEVRRDLVAELTARWSDLDEADRSACEGAITLCDTLERLRPLMGREWAALSEYLISAKKLRLRGRRSAPIQVVGLGDVTGIPFGRAVIAPMNSGIFPSKSFSGPYLNLIHLSRLYRTQYEAEDLALRQFLAFGNTAHIVALYDQASGAAPSPHFSFLATEFGQTAVKRRLAPTPFTVPEGRLVIENTAELKEKLQRHIWSFTSLQKFFTCPCRFILEDIEKIHPPACFEEKEGAGLLIGNFLHRFFADLKDHPPAVEKWQERFDAAWEGDRDLMEKLPDQAARKAIVRSFLSDIAAWELETGRPLLFSDSVTGTELKLTASFGEGGRYQLQGRIDRLQSEGEGLLITDLKYKEKTEVSEKTKLFELVDKPDAFDDRFQLVIYAYLALKNKMVTPGNLGVAYVFLRPKVRGDYEGRLSEEDLAACDATLDKIAQRLDAFLSQESFLPNFHAAGCNYCFHKALCLKPDLYRTGGKPW